MLLHRLNIAVFGSGRGSNFRTLLTGIQDGRVLDAKICLVVSNSSKAGILEIARENAIPALHISEKQFGSTNGFVAALSGALRAHGTHLIVLAGYLKRIPSEIIAEYPDRIINIHPALLPKFGGQGMYGIHVHEAVIASGETISGATVHFVNEEYDRGAILLQRTIPVMEDDTPETLAARVLTLEHAILPEAIRKLVDERTPDGHIAIGHL